MERKPIRNIDLFFFTYHSYYDENDDYVVKWEVDWWHLMVAIVILGSIFGLG